MPLNKRQIKFYASLYDRGYPKRERDLQNEIMAGMKLARERGHLLLNDLESIGQWKAPRNVYRLINNTEEEIANATNNLFVPDVDINEESLTSLINLIGVSYPMASTILYYIFPHLYPVIDFRVMEMVGGTTRYNFDVWEEYVTLCQDTARRYKLTVRDVEKALWKCHQVHDGNMEGLNEWHKRYLRYNFFDFITCLKCIRSG